MSIDMSAGDLTPRSICEVKTSISEVQGAEEIDIQLGECD